MPEVDFSNAFLREYVPVHIKKHEKALGEIVASLDKWAAESAAREKSAAEKEKRAPKPPAATLDIDELILCNIHPNGFKGVSGGAAVDFRVADLFDWPRDEVLNPLYPGARGLLDALAERKIVAHFISGRLESIRSETIANFVKVGLAAEFGSAEKKAKLKNDYVMVKDVSETVPLYSVADLAFGKGKMFHVPDRESKNKVQPFKEECRKYVSEKYRIVLNAGDQASDLGLHGDQQILTPHPFYFTA